jgi:hypothetical protein
MKISPKGACFLGRLSVIKIDLEKLVSQNKSPAPSNRVMIVGLL